MKHIFILNPTAGKQLNKDSLEKSLNELNEKIDFEIILTEKQHHATTIVKEKLSQYPNMKLRFYACGGDGTINEVASSLVNIENVSLAVFPCGSGNDFVKHFGGKEKFENLQNIINGKEQPIDIFKITNGLDNQNYYSINVCNFGFDSVVGKTANEVKAKGGKNPYTKGIIKAIFTGMKHNITVEIDGKVNNGKKYMLLCTLANGSYVGGQYKCAPRSVIDDGLMEVCLIDKIGLFTFLGILNPYTEGKHLDLNKKYIHYSQGKIAKIYSNKNFDICIDGEMVNGNNFSLQVLPKAINFVYPEE